MAGTPHLNELKEISGSDKLHECFTFLMGQEIPENESTIMWLGQQRDLLRISIERRSERMVEVLGLDFDEEEAGDVVYERLREMQVIERSLLESVSAMLVQLRALITKKEETVEELMDFD